jgi:pyruvate dehydrogenase E2 component (dihydrolipoamide acetyltransferase)
MAEIIEMPKLSDTMTTGTLIKWLKKEGDEVASGDMIAEVETDKATMEVEVFEDGVLIKQYVEEGDSVAIGSPICAIGEKGEEAPEVEVKKSAAPEESDDDSEEDEAEAEETEPEPEESSEPEGKEEKSEPTPKPAPAPAKSSTTDGGRVKASPLARKVAEEMGVDLSRVQGTGPGGRIVKADVETASQSPQAPGAGASGPAFTFGQIEEKTEKVSNMRASIAKALVKSKTEAPHFYLQSEVDAEALANIRQDLNSFLSELPPQDGGIKFTVNDLILKAAAMAAVQVPGINRSWQKDTIKQHGSVHLAFGVALDDGLVTPVIRDAQSKSLRQISNEARELIKKARDRKLKLDEMTGSTLTVTNLGMFGITDFYGIINPNNAAILSVGATIKRPVVNEHDQIVVGYRMKVGLSGDHRVIDGAVGAQYLDALRKLLEKPSILVV